MNIEIVRTIGIKENIIHEQSKNEVNSNEIKPIEFVVKKKENNLFYLVFKSGCKVTNKGYDFIGDFQEGLAPVRLNDKWGFIDKDGNEIVKLKYYSVGEFQNGICEVWIERFGVILRGCINKEGKEIVKFKNNYTSIIFGDNFVDVRIGFKNEFIVDANGKKVTKRKYESIGNFVNGLAYVKKNKKYGYIDKQGNEVVKLKYSAAGDFNDGYARIKKDDYWGVIDKTGKEIIKPNKYDFIYHLSEGLFVVQDSWLYGVVDKEGHEIVECKYYNHISSFKEGMATTRQCDKYGYIDNNGNEVIPFIYDKASDFKNGVAIVSKNKKYGIIDKKGNVIIDFEYDNITNYDGNYVVAVKNNKYGLLDINGNIVADFIYKKITMIVNNNVVFSLDDNEDSIITIPQDEFSFNINISQGDKVIEKKFGTNVEQAQYYNLLKKEVDKENKKYTDWEQKVENNKIERLNKHFENIKKKVKTI